MEGPEGSFFESLKSAYQDDGRQAVVAVSGGGFEGPVDAKGVPLILTLVDGNRMLEKMATETPDALASMPLAGTDGGPSIWFILLLALVGGFILKISCHASYLFCR